MLQFRRTFEQEKQQLQELNRRLSQYLTRVKQLEQENASLVTEINAIKQGESNEWGNQKMIELRDLRKVVDRLSLEKSEAEMERQKLWREFKMVQALCCEESKMCRDINAELKGCETQLRQVHKTNGVLEGRLLRFKNEYKSLEGVHRQEIAHLRRQLHSRVLPVVTQRSCSLPAITAEEIEEYALSVSESWMRTFEMYRKRVDDVEATISADEAKLEDLRRDKMLHACEFKKLSVEVEKQKQLQTHLEERLRSMQDRCRIELNQYQVIIEDLEQERMILAKGVTEQLQDYQNLMEVKMGLSLEVATYRLLLEGERNDGYMSTNRASEPSRIIDIKVPTLPYTVKESFTTRKDGRNQFPIRTGFNVRRTEPASSMKASFGSGPFKSHGTTRIIPITVSDGNKQSSSFRRDKPSFAGASQAASTPLHTRTDKCRADIQKTTVEESCVATENSQGSANNSILHKQPELPSRSSLGPSPASDEKSVSVLSPPALSKLINAESDDRETGVRTNVDKMPLREETDKNKVTVTRERTPDGEESRGSTERRENTPGVALDHSLGYPLERQVSDQSQAEAEMDYKETCAETQAFTSEEKVLESVSLEEIIEKIMKPSGLDANLSSSADSKITYHVEKTEQEDGTTKTQIILQSKVEENLDISEDLVLEELLSRGVKKVDLQEIKGTPTASMIENLLSLGLPGDDKLEKKSVNVEIIEEHIDAHSDEESEAKVNPTFCLPSSMFFQIEELNGEAATTRFVDDTTQALRDSATTGERRDESEQIQEYSGDPDAPYISQDQEYFVSTPDDDLSDPEEGGFSSYGHYGAVHDLSDERYYQEESPINQRFKEVGSYRAALKNDYMKSEFAFTRDNFPECIIEEEIQVSPTVQESMLEFLREDSADTNEQLRGALGHLQGALTGPLKEELALFTRNDQEGSENLSVDVRKVQQASDNGTVTIVAEINVLKGLEDSGLLEKQGVDDVSEEKLEEAQKSADPGLQPTAGSRAGAVLSGADEESTEQVSTDQGVEAETFTADRKEKEGLDVEDPANQVNKTEKHIKLGPSEKLFTFKMDVNEVTSASASVISQEPQGFCSLAQESEVDDFCRYAETEAESENQSKRSILGQVQENQMGNWESSTSEHLGFDQFVHTQKVDPQLKIRQEKRIATVYLESPKEN